MSRCLLADIGGTHARFAVLDGTQLGAIDSLPTANHPDALAAIRDFLDRQRIAAIDSAVIAAAGPVDGDRCILTNASWILDRNELMQVFNLRHVRIVNDLEALGWAVPRLSGADMAAIGGGNEAPDGPVAIIAPGTGLGIACLLAHDGEERVLASEGGHATLAATDAREAAVLAFLRQRHGHVSAERVLSGRGLLGLHEALAAASGGDATFSRPEQIVAAVTDGSSKPAREVIDMFCAFLGSFAANAALIFGARGGVLIGGGICPRIVGHLQRSRFRESFESKGRMRGYLARIPTRVVTRRDPAFLGLVRLALRDQRLTGGERLETTDRQ